MEAPYALAGLGQKESWAGGKATTVSNLREIGRRDGGPGQLRHARVRLEAEGCQLIDDAAGETGHEVNAVKMKNGHMMVLVPFETCAPTMKDPAPTICGTEAANEYP